MLQTIFDECSWFLTESNGKPLIKSLPRGSDSYRRIKVRKKKKVENFDKIFNESFFIDYEDLRSRAVFVNGNQIEDEQNELFYIFPVDGYNFIYNKMVKDSNENYRNTFRLLIDNMGQEGINIFKNILNISYEYIDLESAIDSGCEIILYDIPKYYAVRKTVIDNYTECFKMRE